ncbi:hypothetical protein [Thermodesulforhabdus norvegica]|uniref:Uncharacterized protein n=1 Tax=Thermodesulforhabdus norvegica TaxID=39841 RepID=A0A1I4TTC6_9BACT|nr:hypothetical protein [Thermodesulforhabdus norvegica]SFM79845.1 hypothetical protein SAMN05660836_01504 [Thermodesulforhabdus norvegica]
MSCSIRIARLNDEEVRVIRELEKNLGDRFCLLAVEKLKALYVLEAKLGPNRWERVDRVYPEIEGLKAFYCSEEDARLAKSALKSLLTGKMKHSLTKRPIRIRKIQDYE